MIRRLVLMASGLIVFSAACGGSNDAIPKGTTAVGGKTEASAPNTTQASTPSATPTATPTPPPVVEVAFFSFDAKSMVLRFVAKIHNGGARGVSGVRVRWDALDSGGVLVGSFSKILPDIAAGGTFQYVGGAGGLTIKGVATSVKLTVTDAGQPIEVATPLYKVEDVTFKKDSGTAPSYTVSAVVTTGPVPVSRANVNVTAVLRGADGAIVGANFDSPGNVPETIDPGTKFRAEVRVAAVTGIPATAEVVAYEATR